MLNYEVIIFDCDGVIFDSNVFKSRAFQTVLNKLNYPQNVVDPFVNYHKNNGGLSRYVKFKVFITDFLKIPFDQDLYERLLKDFSNFCVESYTDVSLTPCAMEFLQTLSNKIDFYIASGSDEEELNYVFKMKDIKNYFKGILGSPKTKEECILQIVKEHLGKNVLMVGDSKSDFFAAQDTGIDFIFMHRFAEAKDSMMELARKYNFRVIETLEDLLDK